MASMNETNTNGGPYGEKQGQSHGPAPPSITLPKGGGAIRGIGEKFTTNSVTGTGSLSVPIAVSPARAGFNPNLSLSYDSGSGNGPFGCGWNLFLVSISRKTDKGLPRYQDSSNSDIFLLSGAEDLVPIYRRDAQGNLMRDGLGNLVFDETVQDGTIIRRYRPRVEGIFARIEHWTREADGDVHWRSITQENVTVIYGQDSNSRVFSPSNPTQIFTWLISQTYDSYGNAMVYKYKAEDSVQIPLSEACERNRTALSRSSNRYLKAVLYGNQTPNRSAFDGGWRATDAMTLPNSNWMFKVVFDYGEHNAENPGTTEENPWMCRMDPFSTYRSGFEVRTYRLCRRILMFHCFPELGPGDYLVRSMDIKYAESSVSSQLTSIVRTGHARNPDQPNTPQYVRSSLPPLEFEYSQALDPAKLSEIPTREVDREYLKDLPVGTANSTYRFLDLDGEGLSGVFTSQSNIWMYKRNTAANNLVHEDERDTIVARFGEFEILGTKPNADVDQAQFMDIAGDGHLDLVQAQGGFAGFYSRTANNGWQLFRYWDYFPTIDMQNPNLRFVDITGDGLPDILVTENDVFTWYPSLGHAGYGPSSQVHQLLDEDRSPRLVFSDASNSVFLADFSGDGLVDLVRIRHDELCYWPNTGYGSFGNKISMGNVPIFDNIDQLDPKRIILVDIDGSGTTDIIYLRSQGADIYLNQAGNSMSPGQFIEMFPHIDSSSNVTAVDLLGNGTGCLVWSTTLPGSANQSMKYFDMMDGRKPHLLIGIKNNLGAETRISYAPSTRFYLQDKEAGKPWVTRLPFPVHCVERLETFDRINNTYFSTRYAYHHGYFDGCEREFRGFGMVERWDSENFDAANAASLGAQNVDTTLHIPPIHTKTWFHTGAFFGRERISYHMAHEYYGAPALYDQGFELFLGTLPNNSTPQDSTITGDELREACRSLKGSILRQEIYADDGGSNAELPYRIVDKSYSVRLLQLRGTNVHAIFAVNAQETINYDYERNTKDPRVQHEMILQIDEFGNVLKSISISYGRQRGNSKLEGDEKLTQERPLITYSENNLTDPLSTADDYRTPLSAEKRTYEIAGLTPNDTLGRFDVVTFTADDFSLIKSLVEIPFEESPNPTLVTKRLTQCTRLTYRSNDLSRLLPLGQVETLALPGESYQLSLTDGLLTSVLKSTSGKVITLSPSDTLAGRQNDKGGYVDLDSNGNWWIPGGRVFYHSGTSAAPTDELAEAQTHFFMSRRFVDAFGNSGTVDYDPHVLLPIRTTDAVGNVVEAINDYRVLQARLMTDPNGNRTESAFDALGMVAGTAVMGKSTENLGDSLAGFKTDLSQAEIEGFLANPRGPNTVNLLGSATSRIIYDIGRYWRTFNSETKRPTFSAQITRETHSSELISGGELKFQVHISYSDGFGREIQKKSQAEAGPLNGTIVPRWVGSEWTVYNNKGKPVRRYEQFFDDSADFKYANMVGVTSTVFYDPLGRVVLTVHPNHTWEKVVYSAWQQSSYDGNDTALIDDPKADDDVGEYFARAPNELYLPTWYNARKSGQLGKDAQAAALKVSPHANTPSVTHFDPLGRSILTIADNGAAGKYETHVKFDIQGNQREIRDAKGRAVMHYYYDMLGNLIHRASIDSGERWTLGNVGGKPLLSWNSRDVQLRNSYDALQRPLNTYSQEGTATERLITRILYGESRQNPELTNVRQRSVQVFDQAGILTTDTYDFKGNLLRTQRQVAQNYKTTLDWSSDDVPLEDEVFTSSSIYDALNRPIDQTTPDSSAIRPIYNEASLLDRLEVNLHGEEVGGQLVWTPFVVNIDYDAKGQRVAVQYGNGSATLYKYDPLDFRLVGLQTLRQGAVLQDCQYTYDPSGNISNVRDNAQSTIFFRNRRVDPNTEYTYDCIYRLIQASGREHLGQVGGAPGQLSAPDPYDTGRTRINNPGDGNAMGSYVEEYEYDEIGNLMYMKHRGSDPSAPGWTRSYSYSEPSYLEPGKTGDRLSRTSVGGVINSYSHDANGNMTRMPHLNSMIWDPLDRLQATVRQVVNNGGTPETTYYVYDNSGNRVRKVTERQAAQSQTPTRQKERIYLGNFEVFRKYNGSDGSVTLERQTVHVMDDQQRVAMIETKTQSPTDDESPALLIRYQFNNYLGSAYLELDDQAQVISYEEYYPFGSTSYQAVRSQTDTPKRYRYTGKERDEESGLGYHDARYYAAWLGRWTAPDSAASQAARNGYQYSYNNPIVFNDPSGKDPPPQPQQQQAPNISPELEAAWDAAEKNKFDMDSSVKLLDAYDKERKAAGEDLATRKNSLNRAVVDAAAATTNWREGNYVSAAWWSTLGVINGFGVGMFLGDSNAGTAAKTGAGLLAGAAFSRLAKIVARGPGGPSVSIAFKPKLPTGHAMVGVDAEGAGEVAWSDLRVANKQTIKIPGTEKELIHGGDAVVGSVKGAPGADYNIIKVPVSPEEAAAAAAAAARQGGNAAQRTLTGNYGLSSVGTQNCTSYTSSVLGPAGIVTPPISTPFVNYAFVAAQTPRGLAIVVATSGMAWGAMQISQGPVPQQSVVVTSREWEAQSSLREEHPNKSQ